MCQPARATSNNGTLSATVKDSILLCLLRINGEGIYLSVMCQGNVHLNSLKGLLESQSTVILSLSSLDQKRKTG
jgi:hypothetical protein